MSPGIDRTLQEGGVWRRACFTVPVSVSEERVQFYADKYRRKFGNFLEKEGFDVLWMSQPLVYTGRLPVEGGRREYKVFAWCRRRPIELKVDVPDILVPELLVRGMKLAE